MKDLLYLCTIVVPIYILDFHTNFGPLGQIAVLTVHISVLALLMFLGTRPFGTKR